jgi:hypothetical protein
MEEEHPLSKKSTNLAYKNAPNFNKGEIMPG